jgi:hypothetical protein
VTIGNNFSAFLDTFTKTQGFQNLMDFIYNSVGSTNGIDAFGHFLRSNLQLTSCVEIAVTVQSGCEAFFRSAAPTTPTKKKKGKKAKVRKAGVHSTSPIPQVNVPNIQELIPQLNPDQGTTTTPDTGSAPDSGAGDGTTTTTPQQDAAPASDKQAVSMRRAAMFLQFLLGDGA